MNERKPSAAGGIFIALGALGGAGIGIAAGEPSIGLIAGFVAGVIAAVGVALWDARR